MGRVRKATAAVTGEKVGPPIEDDPFGADLSPRPADDGPLESYPHVTNADGEVLHCILCGLPQRATRSGPACKNGHGGAEGLTAAQVVLLRDGKDPYEAPGIAPEKSTLQSAKDALTDFLDETTDKVPVPAIDPTMARIVEHVFQLDAPAEYLRLVDKLSLGDERMKHREVRMQFLDEVDRDTLTAERVLQVAKAHLSAFEIAAQERQAVFRNEAVRQLSAEKGDKNSGPRKKQITEQDVEDYCVSNWGDEWRHVEATRARMKGATAALARLVECYVSRQASLRDICGRRE